MVGRIVSVRNLKEIPTRRRLINCCSLCRFVASFSYYGSVLSSSELLEKNLLCVTNAEREHGVKHRLEDGLCYCIPFARSDYETLLISSLGEVACKFLGRSDVHVSLQMSVTSSGSREPEKHVCLFCLVMNCRFVS